MYTFRYWALVIVAIICYVSASTFEPFLTPFSDQALDSPTMPDSNVVGIIGEEEMQLEKRQAATACPSSYYNCANIGAGNVCCANSQACALDNSGQAACCPYGSVCTGTVGGVVTGGSVPYGGSTRGMQQVIE